jgi:hypothetical protein
MPRKPGIDNDTLEAALLGFQHQREAIDAKMAEIRRAMGTRAPRAEAGSAAVAGKRTLSAAARRRISAAQKKRWAGQKAEAQPKKKHRLSAAARKRIADATRKRWIAYRASKAAAAK